MTQPPTRRRGKRFQAGVALALTLALLLLVGPLRQGAWLDELEGKLLDWRFLLRGPEPPHPAVALVVADDSSLEQLGGWPLPRALLAQAVQRCLEAGARAVVLDMLFADSRAGPAGPELPPMVPALGRGGESGDAALAAALRAAERSVIAYAFLYSREAQGSDPPPAIKETAFRVWQVPQGQTPELPAYPTGLLAPAPELLSAASSSGHVNVLLESGGGLRFADPVIGFGGSYFPALAVEAARLFLDLPPDAVTVRFGQGLQLGARRIPTTRQMRLAVNYRGPSESFPHISLTDVLAGRLPADALAGRMVLMGATAIGTGDGFPSPFSSRMPGIEFQATVVDNLLRGDPLRRGSTAEALDALVLLLVGLSAAALAYLRRPLLVLGGAALLMAVLLSGNLLAFAEFDLWLNLAWPSLALLLAMAWLLGAKLFAEHRSRGDLETAQARLSRYVSPVLRQPSGAGAATGMRHVAVLFVDLKGFTGFSEAAGAAETARRMQRFHNLVEASVTGHHGFIDKFTGDGAMAVFGVLPPEGRAPVDALACAHDLAAHGTDWAEDLPEAERPGISIGLHYGPAVLHESGGAAQTHLSLSGDAVNVASRLEGLTRQHRCTVVASDDVIEAVQAMGAAELLTGFTQLPLQELRGRTRPIGAWAWRSGEQRTDTPAGEAAR